MPHTNIICASGTRLQPVILCSLFLFRSLDGGNMILSFHFPRKNRALRPSAELSPDWADTSISPSAFKRGQRRFSAFRFYYSIVNFGFTFALQHTFSKIQALIPKLVSKLLFSRRFYTYFTHTARGASLLPMPFR